MTVRENQDRWIAALRSGKYKQGKKFLHQADGSMCCLGVAAVLFKPDEVEPVLLGEAYAYDNMFCTAPSYVCEALGIEWAGSPRNHTINKSLAAMNDAGKTFEEIADIFEANREVYTKEGLL